jgi:hypothetical protein
MFPSRLFIALAIAAATYAAVAQAADAPLFAVSQNDRHGQATVFESTTALRKGDVINVRAFNVQPIAMLSIAMCDQDCPAMHIVKTVPLSSMGQSNFSQQIVLPENGRVAMAVQNNGGSATTIFRNGSALWTITLVGPYTSVASRDANRRVIPMSSYTMNDDSLRLRFDHRAFVTVSLAETNI